MIFTNVSMVFWIRFTLSSIYSGLLENNLLQKNEEGKCRSSEPRSLFFGTWIKRSMDIREELSNVVNGDQRTIRPQRGQRLSKSPRKHSATWQCGSSWFVTSLPGKLVLSHVLLLYTSFLMQLHMINGVFQSAQHRSPSGSVPSVRSFLLLRFFFFFSYSELHQTPSVTSCFWSCPKSPPLAAPDLHLPCVQKNTQCLAPFKPSTSCCCRRALWNFWEVWRYTAALFKQSAHHWCYTTALNKSTTPSGRRHHLETLCCWLKLMSPWGSERTHQSEK